MTGGEPRCDHCGGVSLFTPLCAACEMLACLYCGHVKCACTGIHGPRFPATRSIRHTLLAKRGHLQTLFAARHGATPRSFARRSIASELRALILQLRAGHALATYPRFVFSVRAVLLAVWNGGRP